MAAAMSYDPAYTVDIVSSAALGVCAGRVGWPSAGHASNSIATTSRSILITTGEPVAQGASREVDDCDVLGVGARDVASQLRRRRIDGLREVKGIFAGFWLDHRRSECVLFNDRYGIERIFVYTDKSRLYFASEAKAILAVASSTRSVDPAGIAEWLTCGSTIGGRSLFRNIEVLSGGSALTLAPGRDPVRTRYFTRTMLEQLPQLPERQFLEQFDASLRTAVGDALTREPRAAISLTGGLDSRLVIGASDARPRSIPCYTFGSMFRTTGDVAVARAVAAACEQPYTELTLDRPFLAGIVEHARQAVYISDGCLGLPGSAELYLNRRARAIAPARITGNWGGELMRGVRAFKFKLPKGDFVRPSLRALMADARQSFSATAAWHPLSYTLFQQAPHQGYGRYAIERSQVVMRSPFLDNDVVTSLYQAPVAMRTSLEPVLQVLSRRPELVALPTDIGCLGRGPRVTQRARQAYRRAVVKAEYLTSHGAPDWMAALTTRIPVLETAFLGRDKFQHFRLWTRNELAPFVRETLRRNRESLDPWFDMSRVAQMVEQHVAGAANYTAQIDQVVTVGLLHETLLDQKAAREILVAPGVA